jgi:hypothetical protein
MRGLSVLSLPVIGPLARAAGSGYTATELPTPGWPPRPHLGRG